MLRELTKFGLVGGIGFIVDISVFNILRTGAVFHEIPPGGPVVAKLVSTFLAILVNWGGNRLWTFRDRRGSDVVKEGVEFVLASVAGVVVSVLCLWISHYALHLTSVFDDNISANVIGLGIGTAVRFVLYRWWVFGSVPDVRPSESDARSSAL